MKITEFLKKYSLIDNKFIDDFYNFYDVGKNEYDYSINLEVIAKWMNVRKDQVKKTLTDKFTENIDYIVIKETNLKGNNNKHHVLLTYSCAKLLSLRLESSKGDEIRRYYIELPIIYSFP